MSSFRESLSIRKEISLLTQNRVLLLPRGHFRNLQKIVTTDATTFLVDRSQGQLVPNFLLKAPPYFSMPYLCLCKSPHMPPVVDILQPADFPACTSTPYREYISTEESVHVLQAGNLQNPGYAGKYIRQWGQLDGQILRIPRTLCLLGVRVGSLGRLQYWSFFPAGTVQHNQAGSVSRQLPNVLPTKSLQI